jgi:hypothetical protein
LILAGIFAAPVVWLVYARILMPRPQRRKPPARPAPPPVVAAARPLAKADRTMVTT